VVLLDQIGIGVAILVFGAIFAFGDFLPSGSPGQDSSKTLEQKKLPPEEAAKLKVQAQGFEDTLKSTPEDQASLEVVTYSCPHGCLSGFSSTEGKLQL
jgi:hypothetical protein